jgi:O-antigen ligase
MGFLGHELQLVLFRYPSRQGVRHRDEIPGFGDLMDEKSLEVSGLKEKPYRHVLINECVVFLKKGGGRRNFTLLDCIWLILLAYSFLPQNAARELLWIRWYDIPISYIPFLAVFLLFFVSNIYEIYQSNERRLFIHAPIICFVMFIVYIPVQFVVLISKHPSLDLKDYFADYAMFVFYGVCVFYAVTVYFTKKENGISGLNEIIEKSFSYLFMICVISLLRYLVYDISHGVYFFNLFYPLGYRLFEVLFIIFFSTTAIGWYFSTGGKKYLLYFTGYGIALMVAGSRTGYLAYIVLILFIFVRKRFRLFPAPVGVALIVILVAGIFVGGENIVKRMKNVKYVSAYATLNHNKEMQMKRVAYWAGTYQMFVANKIFGVGLGKENFRMNFPVHVFDQFKEKYVARPHITYLYVLCSTGILGFAILGGFIFFILRQGVISATFVKKNHVMYEKTIHLLMANFLILIMQLGYQFETEPFLWMFWGLSFSWFYVTTELRDSNSEEVGIKDIKVA